MERLQRISRNNNCKTMKKILQKKKHYEIIISLVDGR